MQPGKAAITMPRGGSLRRVYNCYRSIPREDSGLPCSDDDLEDLISAKVSVIDADSDVILGNMMREMLEAIVPEHDKQW